MTDEEKHELTRLGAAAFEESSGDLAAVVAAVPSGRERQLRALPPLPDLGPFSCTYSAEEPGIARRTDGGCAHCGFQPEDEIHSEERRKLVASLFSKASPLEAYRAHVRSVLQEEGLAGSPIEEKLLAGLDGGGCVEGGMP